MNVLKIKSAIDSKGLLRLDVPTSMHPGPVDIVMVIQEELLSKRNESKYDFCDLMGKLEWEGDALATQKLLRNEWD